MLFVIARSTGGTAAGADHVTSRAGPSLRSRGQRSAPMVQTWRRLERQVDARRQSDVANFVSIQQDEARWWRDASLAYWESVNGLPLPPGSEPPAHSLEHYRSLTFPEAPAD